MSFEGIFEEVVQKLVPFFVTNWASPRLSYFSQLYVNGLLFFSLSFLLFLKLNRQAFSHTKRGLAIYIFEFRTFTDFFALAKKFEFAFSKFFLEGKFTSNPQLTNNDDIQKGIVHPKNLTVLTHQLIQFQNLFSDLVAKGLVFGPTNFVVSQQITVEFLQHWEQILSKLEQVLVHFGPNEYV